MASPSFMAAALVATFSFFLTSALAADRTELPILAFDEGYLRVFGGENLVLLREGRTVKLALDRRTGSGFASQDLYLYGFFAASIKLPAGYAAGVVVAFYMSNGDVFERTHDELDFEFLGDVRGREWRVQTNVYGNGSTAHGREERYDLGFDPTEDFHRYSILWSPDRIVFSIDSTPVREVRRRRSGEAGGGFFPAKPMSLYATIWDGSSWATAGGRYRVDYKHAPFVAELTDLVLHGCAADPSDHSVNACDDGDGRRLRGFTLSAAESSAMEAFRREHIVYSYCYDRERYPRAPPECAVDAAEARRIRSALRHRRRRTRRREAVA